MTRKQHEGRSETDNMRSSVNSDSQAEELRGDQTTTSLKRAVARRNGRPPNRLNLLAGLSSADLQRLRTRFDEKWTPEPNTGCYLWTASVNNGGYGIFGFRVDGRTRAVGAHRLNYEMTFGPIAEDLDIDHKCRIRSCVNPAHLEAVSHRENMRRGNAMMGLNARKTHCLRGHEFSPENTRPHGNGNRSCRACEKIRNAKRNPLGLPHPATTPMPDALRSFMGARRVAVEKSPYAVRAERKGQLVELVEFLRRVRAEVRDGSTLTQAVADGTLWGWRARQALSHSLGEPVATWDAQPGRTQMERRAVVERSLTECGDVARKGGWRVSR